MDFGAILSQFHKKLDVNSLFKLLIDLHFYNARIRVPQKTKARSLSFSYSILVPTEIQLGPVVRRAGGVRHQLTSHSSSNLLHELLGQATYTRKS
jgi:hypothetical protein